MENREEIEKYLIELLHSGKYPVASLDLFTFVDSLFIKDNIKGQIEYTYELYEEYYKKIKETFNEEELNIFLTGLKETEIYDSQRLEAENIFAIFILNKFIQSDAIDILIQNNNQIKSRNEFIQLHDKVLEGTQSENKLGLRDDYFKFVGHFDRQDNRVVSYFPLPLENIEEAIFHFLNIYNVNKYNDEYEAILKPIIYHALIAGLQLFKDGNSRYGRLLQHSLLWYNLNACVGPTKMPILYASKQYYPYRGVYRKLIENIVIHNDDEAWNKWFSFNLNRLQDSIYYVENNMPFIRKRIKNQLDK